MLISALFKVAGLVVHQKVDVYYKYKAGDLRLALAEVESPGRIVPGSAQWRRLPASDLIHYICFQLLDSSDDDF